MLFLLDTCHYLEMCCHYAQSENDAHSRQADSQFPEFMCPDVIKMVNTYKRLLWLS